MKVENINIDALFSENNNCSYFGENGQISKEEALAAYNNGKFVGFFYDDGKVSYRKKAEEGSCYSCDSNYKDILKKEILENIKENRYLSHNITYVKAINSLEELSNDLDNPYQQDIFRNNFNNYGVWLFQNDNIKNFDYVKGYRFLNDTVSDITAYNEISKLEKGLKIIKDKNAAKEKEEEVFLDNLQPEENKNENKGVDFFNGEYKFVGVNGAIDPQRAKKLYNQHKFIGVVDKNNKMEIVRKADGDNYLVLSDETLDKVVNKQNALSILADAAKNLFFVHIGSYPKLIDSYKKLIKDPFNDDARVAFETNLEQFNKDYSKVKIDNRQAVSVHDAFNNVMNGIKLIKINRIMKQGYDKALNDGFKFDEEIQLEPKKGKRANKRKGDKKMPIYKKKKEDKANLFQDGIKYFSLKGAISREDASKLYDEGQMIGVVKDDKVTYHMKDEGYDFEGTSDYANTIKDVLEARALVRNPDVKGEEYENAMSSLMELSKDPFNIEKLRAFSNSADDFINLVNENEEYKNNKEYQAALKQIDTTVSEALFLCGVHNLQRGLEIAQENNFEIAQNEAQQENQNIPENNVEEENNIEQPQEQQEEVPQEEEQNQQEEQPQEEEPQEIPQEEVPQEEEPQENQNNEEENIEGDDNGGADNENREGDEFLEQPQEEERQEIPQEEQPLEEEPQEDQNQQEEQPQEEEPQENPQEEQAQEEVPQEQLQEEVLQEEVPQEQLQEEVLQEEEPQEDQNVEEVENEVLENEGNVDENAHLEGADVGQQQGPQFIPHEQFVNRIFDGFARNDEHNNDLLLHQMNPGEEIHENPIHEDPKTKPNFKEGNVYFDVNGYLTEEQARIAYKYGRTIGVLDENNEATLYTKKNGITRSLKMDRKSEYKNLLDVLDTGTRWYNKSSKEYKEMREDLLALSNGQDEGFHLYRLRRDIKLYKENYKYKNDPSELAKERLALVKQVERRIKYLNKAKKITDQFEDSLETAEMLMDYPEDAVHYYRPNPSREEIPNYELNEHHPDFNDAPFNSSKFIKDKKSYYQDFVHNARDFDIEHPEYHDDVVRCLDRAREEYPAEQRTEQVQRWDNAIREGRSASLDDRDEKALQADKKTSIFSQLKEPVLKAMNIYSALKYAGMLASGMAPIAVLQAFLKSKLISTIAGAVFKLIWSKIQGMKGNDGPSKDDYMEYYNACRKGKFEEAEQLRRSQMKRHFVDRDMELGRGNDPYMDGENPNMRRPMNGVNRRPLDLNQIDRAQQYVDKDFAREMDNQIQQALAGNENENEGMAQEDQVDPQYGNIQPENNFNQQGYAQEQEIYNQRFGNPEVLYGNPNNAPNLEQEQHFERANQFQNNEIVNEYEQPQNENGEVQYENNEQMNQENIQEEQPQEEVLQENEYQEEQPQEELQQQEEIPQEEEQPQEEVPDEQAENNANPPFKHQINMQNLNQANNIRIQRIVNDGEEMENENIIEDVNQRIND